MARIDELELKSEPVFHELGYLLMTGVVSYAEAATAIETVGIQAYDCFGRLVKLSPESSCEEAGVSIEGALSVVSHFVQEECEALHNNETPPDPLSTHEYWRLQAVMPTVQVYGWVHEHLPDFESLYEKWSKEHSGYSLNELPDKPLTSRGESSVRRLLRALVLLNYGEGALAELGQERSPIIGKIKRDLELKNQLFDDKTLRRWLKAK